MKQFFPDGFKALPDENQPFLAKPESEERYLATKDEILKNAYLDDLPEYIESEDRVNPFDEELLRRTILRGGYSNILRRPVISYKDALDIAYETVMAWVREDNGVEDDHDVALQVLREQESEMVVACEEARLHWRRCVATRKALLEEQDKIVKESHLAYDKARAELKAKAKDVKAFRRSRKAGPTLN